jgi:hypothetical protein
MRVCILLWVTLPCVFGQTREAQQPRYQAGWPCTGKQLSFDPSFARVAEATGGHLVLLDRSEAGVTSTLALGDSKHQATIIRAAGKTESYVDIPFWVDSSVESLFVVASVVCMQTIYLYDPQRTGLDSRVTGVEDTWFRAGRISTVRSPQAGSWTLRLLGTGPYSVAVQANTQVRLGKIDQSGKNLSIWLAESISEPAFRLVDAAGNPIQSLNLLRDQDSPTRYTGSFDPPAVGFRIHVEWRAPDGDIVWRTDPRLIEPPPAAVRK